MHNLDAAVGYWIHLVGVGIEIFGVLVIVLGIGLVHASFYSPTGGRTALRNL